MGVCASPYLLRSTVRSGQTQGSAYLVTINTWRESNFVLCRGHSYLKSHLFSSVSFFQNIVFPSPSLLPASLLPFTLPSPSLPPPSLLFASFLSFLPSPHHPSLLASLPPFHSVNCSLQARCGNTAVPGLSVQGPHGAFPETTFSLERQTR